eukprot:gene19640-21584_t
MDSANANKDIFTWTDSEVELLLECIKSFASNCMFEGKDWEGIKSKYEKIRSIFVEQYPKPDSNTNNTEDYPKFASLDSVTKERISGKIKSLRLNIQGAIASSTFREDMENEESFQSSGESLITDEFTCNTSGSTCDSLAEGSDPEISVTRSSEPHTLVQNQTGERRDRISRFLQDEREKRMTPKMSFEKQQLKYMKEDMEFKKRVAEKGEETDKELLNEAKKMRLSMEGMTNAMGNCFNMMQQMLQMPIQQQYSQPFFHPEMRQQAMYMHNMQQVGTFMHPSNSGATHQTPANDEESYSSLMQKD